MVVQDGYGVGDYYQYDYYVGVIECYVIVCGSDLCVVCVVVDWSQGVQEVLYVSIQESYYVGIQGL